MENLRLVTQTYYDIQAIRLEMEGRVRALTQPQRDSKGKEVGPPVMTEERAEYYFAIPIERFRDAEAHCQKRLAAEVKGVPVWESYLKNVKGIGPCMAAGLISMLDPRKAEHASSFWRYFGMDVREDGRSPHRKKGEKQNWNPHGRVLSWKIGMQFLKAQSPYCTVYYAEKERLEAKGAVNDGCAFPLQREECKARMSGAAGRLGREAKKPPCKEHAHRAASRKMVKLFLSHLWAEWRKLEGLPVSTPYALGKLGHNGYIAPGEMVAD